MPCLLHTSGGRDEIVAMVRDRVGLDVGGDVAGEHGLTNFSPSPLVWLAKRRWFPLNFGQLLAEKQ